MITYIIIYTALYLYIPKHLYIQYSVSRSVQWIHTHTNMYKYIYVYIYIYPFSLSYIINIIPGFLWTSYCHVWLPLGFCTQGEWPWVAARRPCQGFFLGNTHRCQKNTFARVNVFWPESAWSKGALNSWTDILEILLTCWTPIRTESTKMTYKGGRAIPGLSP